MTNKLFELLDDVKQDWGLDPEDRYVRLMADVLGPGVWHRDGSCDAAEALPISRRLMLDIYAWQDCYDAEEARHEAGTAWETTADWDFEAFAARGLGLARRLKAELPDWTIVYHDLAAVRRNGGYRGGAPRGHWEYEVSLDGKVDPGSAPG